jgi:hypothetical protein
MKVSATICMFFAMLFTSACSDSSQEQPIDSQYEYMIQVTSGNFQHGNNGEQLNDPITVRITDSQQTPQANVPLVFEIICGGGRLSLTSTNTDPAGRAEVNWVLGHQSDHILKVSSSNNQYAAESRYVYANTYFAIENQWVSEIPFQIETETISHDNRILESANFLTFSDGSSDDAKVIYSKMAEDAFFEIKQAFGIPNSEAIGVFNNITDTKITIFSNIHLIHDQIAFPIGFFLDGIDAPSFSAWLDADPAGFREWYGRVVKHETMHVMQWLLGLDWDSSLPWPQRWGTTWPEFWFSEGIAEHISGGSFPPIENIQQVNEWRENPDHINPVSILRSDSSPVDDSRIGEYYPMFGLAVRYLLDENGLGRTFPDVKALYLDMIETGSFRHSFQTFMGISVDYYEENFFELIRDFLNRNGTD